MAGQFGTYEQAEGDDLYRRSLYTYMRRSVLPPSMSLFDIDDRDNPHVGTDPTNTPLQALNLMNDVTALEAARMLAERMLTKGGPAAADRLASVPWRLAQGRAWILARQLEAQWGIAGSLQELPSVPRWIINATCYETGKNWRFSQPRMGDYLSHYVLEPEVPIADAIAASAAVPGLIGPLVIWSDRYDWHRYEGGQLVPTSTPARRYELWDGGVYDNLGLEPLSKPNGGFRDGFDLLVVSDASAPLDLTPRTLNRRFRPAHRVLRLVDIASDQVRGLRSRAAVAAFARTGATGAYFRMGNTVEQIYSAVGQAAPPGSHLGGEDVSRAGTFPTTLRRLTEPEFHRIHRYGFEVADATLATRLTSRFVHQGFPT